MSQAQQSAAPSPAAEAHDKRAFSPELMLVIFLPLAAVVASLITLFIAITHAWTPAETGVDRFGRAVEQSNVEETSQQ